MLYPRICCDENKGIADLIMPAPDGARGAKANQAQLDLALAACRSIRFAVANARRHGGDYNLLDILAADKLAREALERGPAMTEEFIDRGARLLLKKYRTQQRAQKGGAS